MFTSVPVRARRTHPLVPRFILPLFILPLLVLSGARAAGTGGNNAPLPWPPPKQLTGFLTYDVVSDYTQSQNGGSQHIVEHYALNFDKLQFPVYLPRCHRGTYYFFHQGTLHLSATGSTRDVTYYLGDGQSEQEHVEYSSPATMGGTDLSAYVEAYADNTAFLTFGAVLPSETQLTDTNGVTTTTQGADLFSDGVKGTVVQRNPLVIQFSGQVQAGNQARSVHGMLTSAPAEVTRVTANPREVLIPEGQDSVEVTFTATTDPPHLPVEWSGDLGDDPQMNGDTLTTRYGTPGVKLVTAEIKTTQTAQARAPRQAAPRNTARLPAIRVRFLTAQGGAMPNPQRVGIPTHLHEDDRYQNFQAVITPVEAVNDVHLEASEGVKLRGVSQSNNVIRFQLAGGTASEEEGDQWVEARDRANTGIQVQPVSVIVPARLVSQTVAGEMETHNWLLNGDTSPAVNGIRKGFGLPVTWRGWQVRVHVQDQFGDDCGELYGGSLISERFISRDSPQSAFAIYQTLGADSQYMDPVGFATNGVGGHLQRFTPVNHQPGASGTTFPIQAGAAAQTDVINVQVDGFPLRPNLIRTLTPTPPDQVVLTTRP